MDEPVKHEQPPLGSIILGYGEKRPPNLLPIAASFSAAVVFLILSLALGRILFGSVLPLPNRVAGLAYFPNASRFAQSFPLPAEAPAVWREAVVKAGPLPIYLGLYLTERDELRAFAVGPRSFRTSPAVRSWIWELNGAEGEPVAKRNFKFVSGSRFGLTKKWMRLWPERLFRITNKEERKDWNIGGEISGNSWITDFKLAMNDAEALQGGPNGLDFISLPQAWPIFEKTLRESGYNFRLGTAPAMARWGERDGDKSLWIEYADNPTEDQWKELAGGFGIFERGTYTLEDGTVVTELRLPSSFDNTSTLFTDRNYLRTERGFISGTSTVFKKELDPSERCGQGKLIAIFDAQSSKKILDVLGMGISWPYDSLLWITNKKGVKACW